MNDDKLQFEGEGNPLIKFQTAVNSKGNFI